MCKFYDPTLQNKCKEPIADDVYNKERANFCDYFLPRPNAYDGDNENKQQQAKDSLSALFGGVDIEVNNSAEDAKKKLEDLFK